MILKMAMVTIARLAYSSVAAPAKKEQEYHLHLGYTGPQPIMQKV
jgi:hypothetical protein